MKGSERAAPGSARPSDGVARRRQRRSFDGFRAGGRVASLHDFHPKRAARRIRGRRRRSAAKTRTAEIGPISRVAPPPRREGGAFSLPCGRFAKKEYPDVLINYFLLCGEKPTNVFARMSGQNSNDVKRHHGILRPAFAWPKLMTKPGKNRLSS